MSLVEARQTQPKAGIFTLGTCGTQAVAALTLLYKEVYKYREANKGKLMVN